MDPYSPYDFVQSIQSYRFGHGHRGISGTVFNADFKFSMVVSGPYETVHTTDCGHRKQGT
jgi:hypothetical protein